MRQEGRRGGVNEKSFRLDKFAGKNCIAVSDFGIVPVEQLLRELLM